MEQNYDNSPAPALERGLAIIEIVAALERPASFTEIVTRSQVPKATANRLLKVLLSTGYLGKTPDGNYVPGAKCNLLGIRSSLLAALELHGQEAVDAVSAAAANTATLFYWNGRQTQVVAKTLHEYSIVMQPVGNVSCDLAGTPWGWLALLDTPTDSPARKQYADLIDSERFRQTVAAAETNGFIVEPPNPYHLRRLAVPIVLNGKTVGFLAIGGNALTIPDTAVATMGAILKKQVAILTERLKCDRVAA